MICKINLFDFDWFSVLSSNLITLFVTQFRYLFTSYIQDLVCPWLHSYFVCVFFYLIT